MRKLFLIILMTVAISCSKDYLALKEADLVVEGWIESGGYPRVCLTFTVPADGKKRSLGDLDRFVIKSAYVSVSDGIDTYILTGHYDRNLYPNYIYTTTRFVGEPGRTYTLTVHYEKHTATAQMTIPQPVPLESAVPQHMDEGEYYIHGTFRNDPASGRYYRCFTKTIGKQKDWAPSCTGTFDASLLGENPVIPIYDGCRIPDTRYKLTFASGSEVDLKFCVMEKNMYEYWSAFENMVALARNPLFPSTADLPSNVDGAIGYWAGYGLYETVVRIP